MENTPEIRIYTTEEKSPESPESYGIPHDQWQALEMIAQRVGGDYGMHVKLGKPGEGSFFDPSDTSITLDPVHVRRNFSFAKFVSAHEGSHRAITIGPAELGVPDAVIEELYSRVGFAYLHNIIEDPAVNDWACARHPGLNKDVKSTYDEQFQNENAALSTPEVQRIAAQLGYWPRFCQYGSEIIRDWHQGRYSYTLDPAVQKALTRTIADARTGISTIPSPENRDRQEILAAAQERFRISAEALWSEMRKLVEQDLHTEELRQMVNDQRSTPENIQRKKQEQKNAHDRGDAAAEQAHSKDIERLEQFGKAFNQLPEDVKENLRQAIERAVKDRDAQLDQDLNKANKEKNDARQNLKKISQEKRRLEKDIKKADGEARQSLKGQLKKVAEEQALQQGRAREASRAEAHAKQRIKESQTRKKDTPLPLDALSQKTREALETLFAHLPKDKRGDYRKQAEQQLGEFEDELNKGLQGKLNQELPPSHRDISQAEQTQRAAAQTSERMDSNQARMLNALAQEREAQSSRYEKKRGPLSGQIDDLYFRLHRILKPEEYGQSEEGYPSGTGFVLVRAMQAGKDIKQKRAMWTRDTAPGIRDDRYIALVDLSGSQAGKKIEETVNGIIVETEAFDRIENGNSDTLTIRHAIMGFHSKYFEYKGMDERLTKDVEDTIITMLDRPSDKDAFTNTYEGTLRAYEHLKENIGRTSNFLLTFSDGEPNYDAREPLKKFLTEGRDEREQLNIKIGLIWLGEEFGQDDFEKLVKNYRANIAASAETALRAQAQKDGYHQAAVSLLVTVYGYDFGLAMLAVTPQQAGSGPAPDDFATRYADLLEDLVKNPDSY